LTFLKYSIYLNIKKKIKEGKMRKGRKISFEMYIIKNGKVWAIETHKINKRLSELKPDNTVEIKNENEIIHYEILKIEEEKDELKVFVEERGRETRKNFLK